MRSLVVATGSSSSIVNHPLNHSDYHLFTSKRQHFLSLHGLISLSLSKPISPSPPSSSSTPHVLLISPHLYPSINNNNSPNNLSHYAEIASKLVEDGRFDEFKMVVESVISSGVGRNYSGFCDLLNSKLLVSGILKGLRDENIKGVIGLFECFSQLGLDVLRFFDGSSMELLRKECYRIVNQGSLEEAVELMEALKGFRFSIKDLVKPSDMIGILVDKRNPCLAVRYACLLPHAEASFCTIIREFGKRSDLASALRVYEASKNKLTGHNMYIYRTIIDACGICGNSFKSRLIYEDLLVRKITPNIFVFNSLMNVNAHDLAYTMEVYRQMQNFGIDADMTSYNILLKACCLSERVDLAQDIYREVQCLESSGALKMDVFTYSTIIKVFADAKLWQMAVKIKEDMLSAGVTPNKVTWSSLISACANAGLVDQASQLFEEMLVAGCEPNSQCFNTLLHACVEVCQYDRAFRLFNTWKSTGSPKADLQVASRVQPIDKDPLASTAQCAPALHHLRFAKSIPFRPTTATYNILLKACGTDFQRARDLMDEMKALGLSPNQISWSILIDICGAAGHVQGAMQILKSMGDSGIRPDVVAYTTAIKVCVENKNSKMAFILFQEMKRRGIKPNLVTYNTLLKARSRYGSLQEIQQCLHVYQDMRRAGYKSNDYYLKLLIEEWCEGVIQKKNEEGESDPRNRADIGGLRSLLLDRVANHLQKNSVESLAVDVQGLTKVEARLVVLAALRMMKENYKSGYLLRDDLIIVLGVANVGAESAVRDGLTKLLKKELGLEVLSVEPSFTVVRKLKNESTAAAHPTSNSMLEHSELCISLDSTTRRPAVLQRLLVTKKSLSTWLNRRLDTA